MQNNNLLESLDIKKKAFLDVYKKIKEQATNIEVFGAELYYYVILGVDNERNLYQQLINETNLSDKAITQYILFKIYLTHKFITLSMPEEMQSEILNGFGNIVEFFSKDDNALYTTEELIETSRVYEEQYKSFKDSADIAVSLCFTKFLLERSETSFATLSHKLIISLNTAPSEKLKDTLTKFENTYHGDIKKKKEPDVIVSKKITYKIHVDEDSNKENAFINDVKTLKNIGNNDENDENDNKEAFFKNDEDKDELDMSFSEKIRDKEIPKKTILFFVVILLVIILGAFYTISMKPFNVSATPLQIEDVNTEKNFFLGEVSAFKIYIDKKNSSFSEMNNLKTFSIQLYSLPKNESYKERIIQYYSQNDPEIMAKIKTFEYLSAKIIYEINYDNTIRIKEIETTVFDKNKNALYTIPIEEAKWIEGNMDNDLDKKIVEFGNSQLSLAK